MILHRFTAPLKSGPGVRVRLEAKSALGQKRPLGAIVAEWLLLG